jgi:hypothetical protein
MCGHARCCSLEPIGMKDRRLRMTEHILTSTRTDMSRRTRAVLVVAATALLITACSSSSTGGTDTAGTTAPTLVATTPAAITTTAAAATTAPASTAGLSGTWLGQYSGAFQGTFTLDWQQSGSDLSGTIKLSNPSEDTKINGTVDGSTIKFGTVASTAITYTGSVSGDSMSGTYKVQAPNGSATGTWSATRKS